MLMTFIIKNNFQINKIKIKMIFTLSIRWKERNKRESKSGVYKKIIMLVNRAPLQKKNMINVMLAQKIM
jgi:hypothetical protein